MSYPRVSEITRSADIGPDYSMIPENVRAERLARAAAIGTASHAAIDLLEQGDLDEASLHPLVRPRVEAYRRFKADTGFVRVRGEFEVRSERWRFQGHPDLTGFLGTERIGIDAKATAAFDADATAIQCAGYALAYAEQFPSEPISRWFGLWLRDDGTYRFISLTKPDASQLFLAALICWWERARRRQDHGGSRIADAA